MTSNLCDATVDKQFDTGDVAAVARRKEDYRFGNFIRRAQTTHRRNGLEKVHQLFVFFRILREASKDRRFNWPRTDCVSPIPALAETTSR